MKIDRTNLTAMRAYRDRLRRALVYSDYLDPVDAYQRELHRVNQEIKELEKRSTAHAS